MIYFEYENEGSVDEAPEIRAASEAICKSQIARSCCRCDHSFLIVRMRPSFSALYEPVEIGGSCCKERARLAQASLWGGEPGSERSQPEA